MAEGRVLKKQISQSRRLPQLKTDSARLLYTWIIPHLDIEGKLNANPFVIKGSVVPRLDHITPELIDEYLLDMHRVELITLYEVDGDRYLTLRKFGEHQNLRPDKEAKSTIPNICDGTPVQVQGNSGTNSGTNSRPTPDEVILYKEKLKEDIVPQLPELLPAVKPPVIDHYKLDRFEEVWSAYQRPDGKGSKKKATEEWKKLTFEQKRAAWAMVDEYLKVTWQEGGKFRPHVERYLKNRLWEGLDTNNGRKE